MSNTHLADNPYIPVPPQFRVLGDVRDYLDRMRGAITEAFEKRGEDVSPEGGGDLYVQRNGGLEMTADWDAGAYQIRTKQFYADVATGTAPFVVDSTTVVANLNADKWDGYEFADYLNQALKTMSTPILAGLTLTGLTASLLLATNADKALVSLPTTTYPSLTELSYVKGVTSALQAQLAGKQTLHANLTSLAALSYSSLSFVKMSAAGTFSLDTATYLTSESDPVAMAYLNQAVKTTSSPTFNLPTLTGGLIINAGNTFEFYGDNASNVGIIEWQDSGDNFRWLLLARASDYATPNLVALMSHDGSWHTHWSTSRAAAGGHTLFYYYVGVSDYLYALGGLHVGGTSDPGEDNCIIDGDLTVTGTFTGSTSSVYVKSATVNYNDSSPKALALVNDGFCVVDVYAEVTTAWNGNGTVNIGDGDDTDGFLEDAILSKDSTGWKGHELDVRGAYLYGVGVSGGTVKRKIYTTGDSIDATVVQGTSTQGVMTVYLVIERLK